MRNRAPVLDHFDTRSVLLFAALTLGSGAVLQARAAPDAPIGTVAQAQPAPPPATNPANRPPTTVNKNVPPPMTTSPAFGAGAVGGTGAAQNPDVRPEVAATRPTARGQSGFDAADRNHDGQVSVSEIKEVPGMATRFQELDTNHDGMLSRAEFDAGTR